MGRKSLATERREELFKALERCIIRYGLEGASLERVAEEAGMTRSIIRHYIGNREEFIDALIARITAEIVTQYATPPDLTPQQAVDFTLDSLFSVERTFDARDKILIDILMTAQAHYPRAKTLLIAMFEQLVAGFAADLAHAYPTATPEACEQVAYAILCLSEMHDSLMLLGMNPRYNVAARASAEVLLSALGG